MEKENLLHIENAIEGLKGAVEDLGVVVDKRDVKVRQQLMGLYRVEITVINEKDPDDDDTLTFWTPAYNGKHAIRLALDSDPVKPHSDYITDVDVSHYGDFGSDGSKRGAGCHHNYMINMEVSDDVREYEKTFKGGAGQALQGD